MHHSIASLSPRDAHIPAAEIVTGTSQYVLIFDALEHLYFGMQPFAMLGVQFAQTAATGRVPPVAEFHANRRVKLLHFHADFFILNAVCAD